MKRKKQLTIFLLAIASVGALAGIIMGSSGGSLASPDSTEPPMQNQDQNAQASVETVFEVLNAMDAMCEPCGIAAMADGSMLISDTYSKVIWQVSDGESVLYAGGETTKDIYGQPMGGYNDSALEKSYFKRPWAIAPFLGGYAVSDAENNAVRLIRDGEVQTLNCSTKDESLLPGNGSFAFSYPTGLAAGDDGSLYISDTHSGAIRQVDSDGNIKTFADHLSDPMGLCWKDGALYVAETGENRILKIIDGEVVVVAGAGEDDFGDGSAEEAAFSLPQGVAVDDDGTVYVADTGNGAVRCIRDGVVTTLFVRDSADMEVLYPISPIGLLLADGKLYVCDNFARKVLVISLQE